MFKQDLTLHFVPLIEDNLHLVCRRDHEFASRTRLSWSEFSDYDERRTIRWSGIEQLIADAGSPGGVQSRAIYSASPISTVLAVIAVNHPVSVLPTLARSGLARERTFHHCPVVHPFITRFPRT